MGGWRPNKPIPALHSDHQPPSCSRFFLLSGGYSSRHGNTCEPACVRRYMRSYCQAARVTVLHLTGTARVRDCPAVPNIAHPELAYTEKPKGKQHKEETADSFMGTKAMCVSIFMCWQEAKTQEAQVKAHPLWCHLEVPFNDIILCPPTSICVIAVRVFHL